MRVVKLDLDAPQPRQAPLRPAPVAPTQPLVLVIWRDAFFGDGRLTSLVADLSSGNLPPAEVLRRTLDAVITHQDGRVSDDATLVLLRWSDDARTIV